MKRLVLATACTILAGRVTAVALAQDTTSIKAYSAYDFVPGEQIVGFDDFTQENIGDFPAKWNTNGAGEIVTIEGHPGRWLMFTRAGVFVPEFVDSLPDNFTMEFDILAGKPFNSGSFLTVSIAQLSNRNAPVGWQGADNRFTVTAGPNADGMGTLGMSGMEPRQNGVGVAEVRNNTTQFAANSKNPVHISIWRQQQRMRVYFNQEKVWDVPRAMTAGVTYNSIIFYFAYVDPTYQFYVSNVRLAIGAPDTRNKLMTDGRFVTHGILFDVNSDRIRAESYGTLKAIAGVLRENPDVRVRIVGHTDADGDAASNLDLSGRRAASVRSMLVAEFSIAEARMETDGKGEAEPADKNDTPAGKANNRRVEFIKL